MSVTETTARRPQRATRPKPVYIARVKVGNGWQTIGAAWRFRSGEPGLSVQLNTLPINFDGRFVLLEPLGDEEAEPVEEPEQRAPRARSKGTPDEEIPF